jgi:phosphonatase-like hydrolase
MESEVKLVMFDMSGTTIKDKNEVLDCFLISAERSGLSTDASEINSMMGMSKIEVFTQLWTNQLPNAANDVLESKIKNSFHLFQEILERWYQENTIEPVDGTLEVFKYLKDRNIKIALGTGFYHKVTQFILNKLGWDIGLDSNGVGNRNTLLDFVISSDRVLKGRPYPYMIQAAMKVLKVYDSKEVIKIGDTPSDLMEGNNANCLYTLGVCSGTHTKNELLVYPNDGIINSVKDLPKFMEQRVLVK